MDVRSVALVAMLLGGTLLAGCLSNETEPAGDDAPPGYVDVRERHLLPFDLSNEAMSFTLEEGPFAILDPVSIDVSLTLPPTELGHAPIGARVHMGIILPDVPEGVKVPVVADVGPYWGESDVPADERGSGRLGETLIQNLVPHGFAVAQVSVLGTGRSNHCMDLMGEAEQLGIDAAVSALASADWSNGNVGLIGRSYDGSTPWEAATFGNPGLKTIVPISGLIGVHELMWRNGTAEGRGPVMHNRVYGTFGVDGDAEDVGNACTDYLIGPAEGQAAYVTGDHVAPAVNSYWAERHFLPRALANYEGSVYLIHGMQDWNVDNHMAFPTHQLIKDNGNDIKGLYGQWQHMYPDRRAEHERMDDGRGGEAAHSSVRYDWTQDLLEWFTYYLKEEGPAPALHAEVQDNEGTWRIEETYPPTDVEWLTLGFDEMTYEGSGPAILTNTDEIDESIVMTLPPMERDIQIAGNVRLHVTVTPTTPGGQLFAQLVDLDEGQRLGHATMDIRYAAGGTEMQPVTPGMPITMKMEFFALDAPIPAGHTLQLTLTTTGEDYSRAAVFGPLQIDTSAASVLKLPVKEPATLDTFLVPGQNATATEDPATT